MHRILIVDDVPVNLFLFKEMLSRNGYEVQTAHNGAEALDAARSHPPDLVISDILMPVMDGYTLCREWHADDQLRLIPFIFYSATFTGRQEQAFGINLGANRFVTKPIDPPALLEVIRQVMEEPRTEVSMKQVLIVDDAQESLSQLGEFLTNSGFGVTTAHNGAEALEAARLQAPDLIISDILMPVMDGYTLCREWRADEHLGKIPFIFYTSTFTEEQDEALAISLGADCFLTRPQEPDELLQVIHRVMALPHHERVRSRPVSELNEEGVLKHYSEALFHKLERKMEALKDVNRDLAEGREMLRLIFDSTAEAIYGIDLHGCCTFCNRACLEYLGYASQEELLGRNMHSQIHHTSPGGTSLPVEESRIFKAFQLGVGTHADDELLWRKDGSSFQAEYWSYPQWKEGNIVGAVVTFLDITDRKQNEILLKQMQGQIIQQEKMASVGQLAAGVAHEINNPMGFITSNLTSLGKYADRLDEYIAALQASLSNCPGHPGLDEIDRLRQRLKVDYIISDIRELINESLDGAKRVRHIVQDLKSFSRLDQAECCSTNINDALETTINIAWNELKYIATLERDFGVIPPVICYPQQLNQVFLNLLVNAAQAMEHQGVITVRTRSSEGTIFVSVSDTGKGMTDEVMRQIFEPFFTTKEQGKGTGLGLSISAEIVRKHGGELTVQSEVGVGTTFTVRLPIESPLQHQGT